jgi:hypothetical protein
VEEDCEFLLVARNAVIAAAVTSRFATYQASQQPGATTAGRSATG